MEIPPSLARINITIENVGIKVLSLQHALFYALFLALALLTLRLILVVEYYYGGEF